MSKAVILAGGLGTRLAEETGTRPKPMVEIGGMPILWHIMKIFATQGVSDFVICLGYKGHQIKDFFLNYASRASDFTVNTQSGAVEFHKAPDDGWSVTLVDTGQESGTAGRLLTAAPFLRNEKDFYFTYGDGLADISLLDLTRRHLGQGAEVTVTAVQPSGRFGALEFGEDDTVTRFREKPKGDGGWTSGGFFMVKKSALTKIPSVSSSWEDEVLPGIALAGKLSGYRHEGFWQPMDTLRDKKQLNQLWEAGKAPWKIWD